METYAIPLLNLPSRGLDTNIVMTYSSKIWKTDEYTDPFGWPAYTTSAEGWIGSNPALGWVIGIPRMGRMHGGAGDVCLNIDPEGGYCTSWISYFNWVTNDGQKFFLGNDNGPQPVITTTTGFWSFDGTYMRVQNAHSWNPGARYKDGVTQTFSGGQAILKDTNGNFVSCAFDWVTNVLGTCTDTLGRLANFNYSNGQLQSVTYIDSSGNTQAITFAYQTFTVEYPWWDTPWCTNCEAMYGGPASLLTRITLPNGLSYEFTYVSTGANKTTGEIEKIKLPTGGYIRYTYDWSTDCNCGPTNGTGIKAPWLAHTRVIATRVVSEDGTAGTEKTWSYDVLKMVSWNTTSTVVDPLGNKEVITPGAGGTPAKVEHKNSAGVALRTTDNTVDRKSVV